MRLLIVNPNTSDSVTRRIADAAALAAFPGDAFDAVSAPFGVPLIVDDADARIATEAVIAAAQARAGEVDGIVIASFGDTGIDRVRQCVRNPVIGIAHAAFLTALAVGDRFSIVSFSPAVVPSLKRIVDRYGLLDRLASVRVVEDGAWDDPGAIQDQMHDRLVAACHRAADDGGASLILGGGPLAGFAGRIASAVPLPVIDGTAAAIHIMRAVLADKANAAAPLECA